MDLAKNVMQIHAVDGVGRVVVRKAIARERFVSWFSNLEPCLSFRHLDPESIEILADSPNFDKKADLQRLSDNFTCRNTCNQLIKGITGSNLLLQGDSEFGRGGCGPVQILLTQGAVQAD